MHVCTDLAAVLENIGKNVSADMEFTGAVKALLRLQKTYQLPASVIMSEKLGGISSVPLSSENLESHDYIHQCYSIPL